MTLEFQFPTVADIKKRRYQFLGYGLKGWYLNFKNEMISPWGCCHKWMNSHRAWPTAKRFGCFWPVHPRPRMCARGWHAWVTRYSAKTFRNDDLTEATLMHLVELWGKTPLLNTSINYDDDPLVRCVVPTIRVVGAVSSLCHAKTLRLATKANHPAVRRVLSTQELKDLPIWTDPLSNQKRVSPSIADEMFSSWFAANQGYRL